MAPGAHVVCPDCLSRDLQVRVAVRGTPCSACGVVATEPLSRREIKACLDEKRRREGATP